MVEAEPEVHEEPEHPVSDEEEFANSDEEPIPYRSVSGGHTIMVTTTRPLPLIVQ